MKNDFSMVLEWSLILAKKFGFIPRTVVWELLSPKGRTARYTHWRNIQKCPLLIPYVIGSGSAQHLILSAKGKEFMGVDAVAEVESTYLAHDEIVMRFCLLLMQQFFIRKIWSEGELKKDRSFAVKSLGDSSLRKLPDLLFDLGESNSSMRFALEVERTRKSSSRYKTMIRAYQRAAYVDGILFGVADAGIEEAIKDELMAGGLEFFDREIGFFSISDFLENNLQAKLRLREKEFTLESYFHEFSKKDAGNADFKRHGVRVNLREVSGDTQC